LAKVTGPLFSLDASGKFADSLVFMKWKGINTVRQYTKPANVNTIKQQAVKKAFTAASAMYKTLFGPDKEAWKLRASGQPMSGYNAFMGLAVKALKELRAFTLINKVQINNITATSADILITASEDGEARLEYGDSPGSYYESVPITLQKDTEISVPISGLTASIDYYFRIVQDDILLDTPENLLVTAQGTPGTTAYGYKVTAISKAGETLPCEEVSISNGADVLRKAKLPTKYGIHTLRHTFATINLENKVSPKVVQIMLGHSTISTTLDIYSHVDIEMQKEAVAKLDDAINLDM